MKTVLLIGTLDTKGPEIAYVRDRLQALGVGAIVADSGILGEPLDIVPDVSRAEVARLGGTTIEALRNAGSRGKAVHGMLLGLQRLALDLYRDGRLDGVAHARRRGRRGARRERHDCACRSASPRSSSRPSRRATGGSGRSSGRGT